MRSGLLLLSLSLSIGCGDPEAAPPGVDSATEATDSATDSSAATDTASDALPQPDSGVAADSATPPDSSDSSVPADAADAGPLPGCLGEAQPIVLGAKLPFVEIGVGATKSKGSFLVDFGTTASTIDLAAFTPAPAASGCDSTKLGQSCTFADFDFFGSWGAVKLFTADHSGLIGGVREAGIVGTDFLSVHTFTLDYPGKRLLRAKKGALCSDAELSAAGFATLSSAGFYANDFAALEPLSTVVAGAASGLRVPNVPTVPVRIAGTTAVAQLDTGFADSLVPFSINVNAAFYDAIAGTSPAALVRVPAKDLALTTCVPGVTETVEAYTLASGVSLQLMSAAGAVARAFPSAVVFVKRTPASAKGCGGIGTWTAPAGQLAASFFVDLGVVVFDPFRSRVLVR